MVVVWAAVFCAAVWQQVGIWRSAENNQQSGRTWLWGGAARVMVILGVIASASVFLSQAVPQINEWTKLAFGEDPIGKYEIHLLRDGTELEISGPITFGLTDDVRRILDASSQVQVVHLNSIGGRTGEARKLRDLIRKRSLITYTATGCSSACTIAFLGGQKRLIASEARLGFHQYTFPGMDQTDMQVAYAEDRQSMIAAGILPGFADRAFSTPAADMWHPSPEELLRAGVITGFASKTDFARCSRIYDEATTSNGEAWLATGREKYPDFDTVVLNPELSITETMRDLIVLSEVSPDIAYYLGHHPAEARTIALRSPVAQAHAFGRIAAGLGHVTSVRPRLTASEAIRKCIERVVPQKIHEQ